MRLCNKLSVLAGALMLFSAASFAGYSGPGDAEIVESTVRVPVAESKSTAILHGHVIEQVGEQRYLFEDKDGRVMLRIHPSVIKHTSFGPETEVSVFGYVKHKKGDTTVDVKRLTVL